MPEAATYTNRKDHIRSIAQQLFRERGYAATSMRHLASEVGIEPASLYSHVKSKEEILHAICFDMAEAFFTAQKSISATLTPQERLRKGIIAHIDVVIQHRDAAAVFFHDWRHLGEKSLKDFRHLRHEYENIFRTILKEGMQKKAFRMQDENVTLYTLFSAMNWAYEWYSPERGHENVGMQIAEIVINGIKQNSNT
jgi:AcrR family transcriptional regulator